MYTVGDIVAILEILDGNGIVITANDDDLAETIAREVLSIINGDDDFVQDWLELDSME